MAVSSSRLVNALRDRGHRVTVYHLTGGPADDWQLRDSDGVTQIYGWQSALERLFFLKRQQLSGKLLVGFGGGLPGYLASLWGHWLTAPSLALFRGNDLDRLIHDPTRGWLVHQTIQQADLVGAVARDMQQRIAALRSGPVIHTPVGIVPDEWHWFPSDLREAEQLRQRHSPDGRPLVGVFGQLKAKKGLWLAQELFHNLGFGRHARLLTVGELTDADRQQLEEQAAEYWSHEPFRPRDQLLPLYLACDLVLLPSLYDGMPNVLLEAMLCGRPVVASNAGGIPDLVSHGLNGLLFPAGDLMAAAEALDRALALTPDERARLAEAGRHTVCSGFTADHEAEILETALVGLAAPRS